MVGASNPPGSNPYVVFKMFRTESKRAAVIPTPVVSPLEPSWTLDANGRASCRKSPEAKKCRRSWMIGPPIENPYCSWSYFATGALMPAVSLPTYLWFWKYPKAEP